MGLKIETDRLILRPLDQSDAQEMFAYRSDKDTNKYQEWIPESEDETQEWIKKLGSEFNIENSWFQLAIIIKEGNNLIGDMGVHFMGPDNQQCELGITLSKNQQGKGYAREAMGALIEHLFSELKKHRIIATLDPDNSPSINLLNSLGFRKEAHHIKSYLSKGKWLDDLVFALLKEDWKLPIKQI